MNKQSRSLGFTLAEFVVVFSFFLLISAAVYNPLKSYMVERQANLVTLETSHLVNRMQAISINRNEFPKFQPHEAKSLRLLTKAYDFEQDGSVLLPGDVKMTINSNHGHKFEVELLGYGMRLCAEIVDKSVYQHFYDYVEIDYYDAASSRIHMPRYYNYMCPPDDQMWTIILRRDFMTKK